MVHKERESTLGFCVKPDLVITFTREDIPAAMDPHVPSTKGHYGLNVLLETVGWEHQPPLFLFLLGMVLRPATALPQTVSLHESPSASLPVFSPVIHSQVWADQRNSASLEAFWRAVSQQPPEDQRVAWHWRYISRYMGRGAEDLKD